MNDDTFPSISRGYISHKKSSEEGKEISAMRSSYKDVSEKVFDMTLLK